MTLKVIGAGFGRTGTMSLKLALEQLGFDPCYHMFELGKRPEHDPVWLAATRHEEVNWDALFTDFSAAVDWPVAAFWREMAAYYPQAKFILTERDPQAWYRSIQATIFKSLNSPPAASAQVHRQMTRELIFERTFGGRWEDEAHVIDTYLQHNQAVRDTLPESRLLVYQTGSGWAPLTQFLGLPEPSTPYPMTNTTEQFQQRAAARVAARASEAK
jgi:hypothetical protein